MSTPTWVTAAGTLGTIPEGVFYGNIILEATAPQTVFYKVIAGRLPPGIWVNETGVLSGNPNADTTVQGAALDVTRTTTSTFVVRAYTENGTTITGLSDRTFSLTVTNQNTVTWITPAGNIGNYIDGVDVVDLQVQYNDTNVFGVDVVTLIAGTLPPGLSVSDSGIISGYITPDSNATQPQTDYSFTLRVSNGTSSDVRTFSILVYARSLLTADTTYITADNTYITADTNTITPPVIITPPGNIGSTRSDNFFAFQFVGANYSGTPFEFVALDALPPGLNLDPISGWLYGYVPLLNQSNTTYDFRLVVREISDPSNASDPYSYNLTVLGTINTDVVWLSPMDLGLIDNGATSTFNIAARNVADVPLQYQLLSGSDSRLPQGLELLPSGNIAGRVSFDTFAVDGGTTTFDVGLNTVRQPTTFDMTCTFTVNAYSLNGLVSANKTFTIRVVRRYDQPYDNLYIQAMPPNNDRNILDSLLQNPDIFTPALIYRGDDPNFGVATRVVYNHAYGLTAATIDDYVASLNINHYWKNLVLGPIETARALDDNGEVIYEVVYCKIIDDLVNNQDVSVGKQVVLPFPINAGDSTEISVVYPNSLQNMRDQVVDTVGQVSNVLPRWQLSRQPDGTVLGYVPAWVIAYTKPGQADRIVYNIQTLFNGNLNEIDYEVDRYELDGFLTKNWNREGQNWGYYNIAQVPYPPSLTTFDIFGVPAFDPYQTTLTGAGTAAANQTYKRIGPYRYAGDVDSKWIMYSVDFGNTWKVKQFLATQDSYISTDLITWTAVTGAMPAPTGSFYQVGDTVIYQTVVFQGLEPAYRISKLYECILPTTPGILPTNTTYWNDRGQSLATWENNANVITTWEDNLQTLADWSYATRGYGNNVGQGTTFDGNSLLFTAPVDMYSSSSTTDFDKYLVFPRRNILE